MKLSKNAQLDLDELAEERRKRKQALDRAQAEYDKAGVELLAFLMELGVSHATTSDGYSAEITQVVDWRNIDAEAVERDFPRDEYPAIYTPDYRPLKVAANERVGAKDPDSTAAVSKYTGFTQQLRLRKLKSRTNRRFR